jgi:serine protease Do
VRVALEGYHNFEQTVELTSTHPATLEAELHVALVAPHPKPSPGAAKRTGRAYFGVVIQNLTPETARTFNSPDTFGALVQQVDPHSPAAAAGLQVGDVIRSFNEEPLQSADELKALLSAQAPGAEVGFEVLRNGSIQIVSVKLGAPRATLDKSVHITQGPLRGLTLVPLTDPWRKASSLPAKTQGVVVDDIDPHTPAAQVGLARGDVIEDVNREKVKSLSDFPALAEKARADDVLLVYRQGNVVLIKLSAKP